MANDQQVAKGLSGIAKNVLGRAKPDAKKQQQAKRTLPNQPKAPNLPETSINTPGLRQVFLGRGANAEGFDSNDYLRSVERIAGKLAFKGDLATLGRDTARQLADDARDVVDVSEESTDIQKNFVSISDQLSILSAFAVKLDSKLDSLAGSVQEAVTGIAVETSKKQVVLVNLVNKKLDAFNQNLDEIKDKVSTHDRQIDELYAQIKNAEKAKKGASFRRPLSSPIAKPTAVAKPAASGGSWLSTLAAGAAALGGAAIAAVTAEVASVGSLYDGKSLTDVRQRWEKEGFTASERFLFGGGYDNPSVKEKALKWLYREKTGRRHGNWRDNGGKLSFKKASVIENDKYNMLREKQYGNDKPQSAPTWDMQKWWYGDKNNAAPSGSTPTNDKVTPSEDNFNINSINPITITSKSDVTLSSSRVVTIKAGDKIVLDAPIVELKGKIAESAGGGAAVSGAADGGKAATSPGAGGSVKGAPGVAPNKGASHPSVSLPGVNFDTQNMPTGAITGSGAPMPSFTGRGKSRGGYNRYGQSASGDSGPTKPIVPMHKSALTQALGSGSYKPDPSDPDYSHGGKDRYNTRIPASLRHNNPGATWDAPWMKAYGMPEGKADIIGGGNHIAYFPTMVQGAAANFDLMNRAYAGKPLSSFIHTWSGGNSSAAYTARVAKALGISGNTVITREMIHDPDFAAKMLYEMSRQESGNKEGPMTLDQLKKAHGLFRQIALGEKPKTPFTEILPGLGKIDKIAEKNEKLLNKSAQARSDAAFNKQVTTGGGKFNPEAASAVFKPDPKLNVNDKFGSMAKVPSRNSTTRRGARGEYDFGISGQGQQIFHNIWGGRHDPKDLTYIKAPNGQMVQVAKAAAPNFKAFLDELYQRGYDMKKVGGYSDRAKNSAHGATGPSVHSTGSAIDIDEFKFGNDFSTRTVFPEGVEKLAWKYGLSWGVRFGDAMHFEYMSPQLQAQRLQQLVNEGYLTDKDVEKIQKKLANGGVMPPEYMDKIKAYQRHKAQGVKKSGMYGPMIGAKRGSEKFGPLQPSGQKFRHKRMTNDPVAMMGLHAASSIRRGSAPGILGGFRMDDKSILSSDTETLRHEGGHSARNWIYDQYKNVPETRRTADQNRFIQLYETDMHGGDYSFDEFQQRYTDMVNGVPGGKQLFDLLMLKHSPVRASYDTQTGLPTGEYKKFVDKQMNDLQFVHQHTKDFANNNWKQPFTKKSFNKLYSQSKLPGLSAAHKALIRRVNMTGDRTSRASMPASAKTLNRVKAYQRHFDKNEAVNGAINSGVKHQPVSTMKRIEAYKRHFDKNEAVNGSISGGKKHQPNQDTTPAQKDETKNSSSYSAPGGSTSDNSADSVPPSPGSDGTGDYANCLI